MGKWELARGRVEASEASETRTRAPPPLRTKARPLRGAKRSAKKKIRKIFQNWQNDSILSLAVKP